MAMRIFFLLASGLCLASLVSSDLPLVSNQDNSICRLPKETGPCRNIRTRFYFNIDSKKCEAFVYGGCRGNANNFASIEDCHIACETFIGDPGLGLDMKIHIKTPHCLDPPIKNPRPTCRAYFPR